MDDNELYPIGDVARRTGLSVSAIRFYADAGLEALRPGGVVPLAGETTSSFVRRIAARYGLEPAALPGWWQ